MSGLEHDDLIQGEIDGVNTSADSVRLKALLAARPDLNTRFETLRGISETLIQAERLDPPSRLTDDVMAAVRRRKEAGQVRPGWLQAVHGLFAPAPLVACACALVLGVALGALVPPDSALFSRSEKAALSGTALPQGRLDRPRFVDRQAFDLEGVRGEVTTRIEGDRLAVDLLLDSRSPTGVSLELDDTGLSPRAFSRDGPGGGDVVLGSHRVQFSHAGGRCRYTISFSVGPPGEGALRLRVGDRDGSVLALGRKGP